MRNWSDWLWQCNDQHDSEPLKAAISLAGGTMDLVWEEEKKREKIERSDIESCLASWQFPFDLFDKVKSIVMELFHKNRWVYFDHTGRL